MRQLTYRQAGVLARNQLAAAGIGKDEVRAAVPARRWQAVGRRVVVLANAPLTETQRRWLAVLAPGKPAALAGLSAAAAFGLRGFPSADVHIVVAGSCGAGLPGWVRLHNSRRFARRDIAGGSSLPRTRIARSLVDAAAWSGPPRRACAILCAGVQQRLVTAGALAAELETAGQVRHVRYVDAEFDLADGTTLIVEVDGAVHLKPVQWWDDLSRQNELVIGGRPVLRFDSVTIRVEPRAVVDQLARMRRAHER